MGPHFHVNIFLHLKMERVEWTGVSEGTAVGLPREIFQSISISEEYLYQNTVNGLNNEQVEYILGMVGVAASRGKYFNQTHFGFSAVSC